MPRRRIFRPFFCASENVSYFILSVRFSGPSLAPEGRGISEPAQLLGDNLFTAHSLPLTFEDYWLVLGQWRCIGVRYAKWWLKNCRTVPNGFYTTHCYPSFLKSRQRQSIFVQFRTATWSIYNTETRRFKIQTSDMAEPQITPRGGGGTAIYGLYRYVPLWRVWFSSSLL